MRQAAADSDRGRMRGRLQHIGLVALATLVPHPVAADDLVASYLERYFEVFPSAATAAGRHDLDGALESFTPARIEEWLAFNQATLTNAEALLEQTDLAFDQQLDLELLIREARRQVFDFDTLKIAATDPLFWTGLLSDANVFLLVRDDLPLSQRLQSVLSRTRTAPRLVDEARTALARSAPAALSPDLCRIAADQARATAMFYRQGLSHAAPPHSSLENDLGLAGEVAAEALERLAEDLSRIARVATGTFRLGDLYAERFRLVTGVEQPVAEVLANAERALVDTRAEAAAYGRQIWAEVFPGQAPPEADSVLIEAMFGRIAEDRATTVDEFVDDYRNLAEQSVEFVRSHDVITLPEPLTLKIERSPSFFIGQSVGGVYPAGPFADPAARTLLFLPMPPDDADAAALRAFFRDFNHHFNVMITPHELIPGHYLQLKFAALQPHKIRALFGDGVYIEGWGTFVERLMLDLGWGEPLDRVAHLKKRLENVARTIVDIRVHTEGVDREAVSRFVQDEALQDLQFADNMWRRTMTSSPQLTFYFLGYREVHGLFEDVRERRGPDFRLQPFMDGMMSMGPVPVRHYREVMLGNTVSERAHPSDLANPQNQQGQIVLLDNVALEARNRVEK